MKCIAMIVVFTGIALSGCGAPDDAESSGQSIDEQSVSSRDTAETPSEVDDEGAWFFSDARPVNRACNEPDYRPGQPDTYPALHSPLYPVIQEKQQKLLAAVKALAPTVTDEDTYDLEADLKLRRDLNALSQFVFVMSQDLKPRYLLGVCDISTYDDGQCALMQRLSGGAVTLSDYQREGDSLRYNAQLAKGGRATLTIVNRDLDGLKQQLYSRTDGNYNGEWVRAEDGTETFSSTGSDGSFSYTENPDCSGVARAVRTDDGGHPWDLSWRWSSVREPETFWLQYSECKVNGLNERECFNGSI